MRIGVLLIAALLALGACSGDDDTANSSVAASTTTEAADQHASADMASAEERAQAYALEKSGGETLGCSSAAPGAESESNPGCIYAVSFAGCLEGITGEQMGLPVEQEFQTEPALVDRYHQAVGDCS